VIELSRWSACTIGLVRGKAQEPAGQTWILTTAFAAVIPLITLPVVYSTVKAETKTRDVQAAGEWLNSYAPGPKTVMDLSTMLSFHADATFVPFPYCDSDIAVRYLDKKNVDFIVLSEFSDPSFRPYLQDWMEHGPPPTRAQLVRDVTGSSNRRIRIYRWSPPESNSNVLTKVQ
jgi:hypothetical protein